MRQNAARRPGRHLMPRRHGSSPAPPGKGALCRHPRRNAPRGESKRKKAVSSPRLRGKMGLIVVAGFARRIFPTAAGENGDVESENLSLLFPTSEGRNGHGRGKVIPRKVCCTPAGRNASVNLLLSARIFPTPGNLGTFEKASLLVRPQSRGEAQRKQI